VCAAAGIQQQDMLQGKEDSVVRKEVLVLKIVPAM
jgi:hypothetical protein